MIKGSVMKRLSLAVCFSFLSWFSIAEPVSVEITGTVGERWASTSEGWLERCYYRGRQDLCQTFEQGSEVTVQFTVDSEIQPVFELGWEPGWYYFGPADGSLGFSYGSEDFIWPSTNAEWRDGLLREWAGYTYDKLTLKGRELSNPFVVNGFSFDRIYIELSAFAPDGENPSLTNADSEGNPLFPTEFDEVQQVSIILGSSCPDNDSADFCGDMIRLDLLTSSDERSFTFSGNVIFGDRIQRAANGDFVKLPLPEIPYGSAANVEFNLNAASFDRFMKDEDWASADSRAEYELGALGAKWEFPELGLSVELPAGMLIVSDNYDCAADAVCDEISLYSESPSFLELNATSGNTYLNQRGDATESTLIDSDQVPSILSISENDSPLCWPAIVARTKLMAPRPRFILGIGNIEVINSDDDGDGVPNEADTCPATAAGEIVDLSGCSVQQSCPCENSWKNHGQMVSCTSSVAEIFVSEGLITDEEKDAIVREAAKSSCGETFQRQQVFERKEIAAILVHW